MYRLDKLLEDCIDENFDFTKVNNDNVNEWIDKLNEKTIFKDDPLVSNGKIQYKSLMMKTISGDAEVGLRPETATATYADMSNIRVYANGKPIRVFQIGKSFRNEISPKNLILRGREFTQAEAHIVMDAEELEAYNIDGHFNDFKVNVINDSDFTTEKPISELGITTKLYAWLVWKGLSIIKSLGIDFSNVRLRRHREDERAFYAKDAWDIEIKLNGLGWTEIVGIHHRGTYDLRYEKKNEAILELAMGIDRLFYAMMDTYYEKKDKSVGKTMLRIPYKLASIQVSVLPLMKNKPDLVSKANEWFKHMKKLGFNVEYDEKSAIGKRYLRNNLKGIPYSITIDFTTLEDDTVTLRDRDTENQVRVCKENITKFMFF
jgi:glycyl-tRNA synthetase